MQSPIAVRQARRSSPETAAGTRAIRARMDSVNDPLEREADRMAEAAGSGAAMQGWSFSRIGINNALQRKCTCEGSGSCEACTARKGAGQVSGQVSGGQAAGLPELQRKAMSAAPAGRAPPIVQQVLRSSGMPLDSATRGFFESRMGHDFGRVRVHTDVQAAQSARAVNALAYTVGHHVVFGEGRYAPRTSEGRGLLAHELTHTIQQGGVQPRLEALAPDRPGVGSGEGEAERVRAAIQAGARVEDIRERAGPTIQRVPGSPAGGCGVCYGTPKAVGTAAHVEISRAFTLLNPTVQAPFSLPLIPSPSDDNGVLDLALLTGSNTVEIGEIKPANPRGLLQGDSDLFWYEDQLKRLGFTVRRMILPPPLSAIPFPTLAPPPCPPVHDLFVDPPVHGIYTYWCTPDFAELIAECPCKPPQKKRKQKEKVRVPVKAPQKVPKKVPERARAEDKEKEKGRQPQPVGSPSPAPIPGKDLIPVLVAIAAMTAIASKMKKVALGRAFAYVNAAAIIILLASGAEASVGLKGDDAMEALFKLAQAHGYTIPDDIKEKLRRDPRLKAALEKGAQTGDFSDAQRQAAEQLTRFIADHSDEFTDEELDELLKASEGAKGAMPGGELTVQQIKQAIAARKSGAAGSAAGKGGATTPRGQGSGAKGTQTRPTQGTGSGEGAKTDETKAVAAAKPTNPPERLVEAMGKAPQGPVLTPALKEKLLSAARAVSPPLTDKEVDQLIARLGSAVGKSDDEILDSVRKGVAELRAEAGHGTDKIQSTDAAATDAADAAKKADQGAPLISTDQAVQKKPQGKEDPKVKAELEAKYKWVTAGTTLVAGRKGITFVDGKPFTGFIIGRDKGGALFLGRGPVTPHRAGGGWTLEVPAGIPLYGAAGPYGKSNHFSTPAWAGVGERPKKTEKP